MEHANVDVVIVCPVQTSIASEQGLNQLLAWVTPQTPTAHPQANSSNPWPMLGQSLAHRDPTPAGGSPSLISPHAMPLELRQQALQKLQQQQQHQQGAEQGMSGDVSVQPGSSRQSSGTMQRNFQSPTLASQQPSGLSAQQLLLLQQHMQVPDLVPSASASAQHMATCAVADVIPNNRKPGVAVRLAKTPLQFAVCLLAVCGSFTFSSTAFCSVSAVSSTMCC